MNRRFRYLAWTASLLCLLNSGCDFGTYGSRVADREAELRDPSLMRSREAQDTTTDFEYYHQMYREFFTANQRVAQSWEELTQYATSLGGQRGSNASAALGRVSSAGYIPNWNLNPNDTSITNLDGQTILNKPEGGSKVLYNGTVIP